MADASWFLRGDSPPAAAGSGGRRNISPMSVMDELVQRNPGDKQSAMERQVSDVGDVSVHSYSSEESFSLPVVYKTYKREIVYQLRKHGFNGAYLEDTVEISQDSIDFDSSRYSDDTSFHQNESDDKLFDRHSIPSTNLFAPSPAIYEVEVEADLFSGALNVPDRDQPNKCLELDDTTDAYDVSTTSSMPFDEKNELDAFEALLDKTTTPFRRSLSLTNLLSGEVEVEAFAWRSLSRNPSDEEPLPAHVPRPLDAVMRESTKNNEAYRRRTIFSNKNGPSREAQTTSRHLTAAATLPARENAAISRSQSAAPKLTQTPVYGELVETTIIEYKTSAIPPRLVRHGSEPIRSVASMSCFPVTSLRKIVAPGRASESQVLKPDACRVNKGCIIGDEDPIFPRFVMKRADSDPCLESKSSNEDSACMTRSRSCLPVPIKPTTRKSHESLDSSFLGTRDMSVEWPRRSCFSVSFEQDQSVKTRRRHKSMGIGGSQKEDAPSHDMLRQCSSSSVSICKSTASNSKVFRRYKSSEVEGSHKDLVQEPPAVPLREMTRQHSGASVSLSKKTAPNSHRHRRYKSSGMEVSHEGGLQALPQDSIRLATRPPASPPMSVSKSTTPSSHHHRRYKSSGMHRGGSQVPPQDPIRQSIRQRASPLKSDSKLTASNSHRRLPHQSEVLKSSHKDGVRQPPSAPTCQLISPSSNPVLTSPPPRDGSAGLVASFVHQRRLKAQDAAKAQELKKAALGVESMLGGYQKKPRKNFTLRLPKLRMPAHETYEQVGK